MNEDHAAVSSIDGLTSVRLMFEGFDLDPRRFELRHNGVPVAMEPQVFDVLSYLIDHRDRVVPKEELLDEIWGDRFVSESALTSRIKAVRRALGDDGAAQRFVETRRGRGYRFVAAVTPADDLDRHTPAEPGPRALPAMADGTVAFLFTEVDESARLWEQHPDQMHVALEQHDGIVRAAIAGLGGHIFARSCGSLKAAFGDVDAAAEAATRAQRGLADVVWPKSCAIQVRMGLHVGEARSREGHYLGPAPHKAARIMSAGRGGQVLASAAFAARHSGGDVIDLGEHRLSDLTAGEHLFQIGPGAFGALRTLDAVDNNLPVERTLLVGRDTEIPQVARLLHGHRLVTLLGMGGTGKTRLAAAVAADQVDEFADGVWFVDLVPVTTRAQVAEAIANAAGLQLNESDVVAALAGLIANRRMLVVLDNCEHITDEVADVVDNLLARTSAPRWLATSREPLQLPDERQMRIAPLAVDRGMTSPAVQLFAAAAERVDVVIDEADVATIAYICGNLDGLPLSIELAAAQLRHLSLDELAARLDQRFEILARGRGGRTRRQASLQAVLEDTWEMLDAPERELLMQLAAFASSFTIDDVEAISSITGFDAPAHQLAGLVDRGLVSRDGQCRHRVLETVKLFARQCWSTTDDPDAFLERHTTWVLRHLDSYEPQEWYTSFALLSWARVHYADHRAVEDRLLRAGRTAEVCALLRALTHSYCYETGTRASAVIERIDKILGRRDLTSRERGLLHVVAATAGLPARRPDRIDKSSAAAVPLLRPEGAPEEIAAALIVASWMTVFRDFDLAIAMLDEAGAVATSAGADALADVAMGYSAGHHAIAGRMAESRQLLDEVGRRLEHHPFDYAGSIHRLYRLAVHIVDAPELSRAEGERLSADFAALSGDGGIGWGLPLSTCVAVAACGDIASTRRLVAEIEALNRLTSNADGLPDLFLPAAALAWRLGQRDIAHRWLSAIRRAPKPTQNFHLTIMYRLLRNELGVHVADQFTVDELRAEYAEAVEWMAALEPITA